MCHTGNKANASGKGCGGGVDEFAVSVEREHERDLYCSKLPSGPEHE